jgi:hypothetical protein
MALHQPALHWQMHLIYVYGYTMANASNRSLVGWVPNLVHGIYLPIVVYVLVCHLLLLLFYSYIYLCIVASIFLLCFMMCSNFIWKVHK